MTTLRKLQAEIDKTLKQVAVGVEVFEQTFEKLGHATNATSKDKLENDLKSQIKKLQRMRDQIKAWCGSNDIKDKSTLMENRRLIELQMERFKALEKEMKMKAFSKEGLMHASKLDPAEKARRDMIDWVGTSIEEIARQVEATEAELESLTAGKKKKSGQDRVNELEELNERRTWHIGRMEIVQRMLENGSLSTEAVEGIQEDIKYFMESNADEDFDYDTGIYDDLNLMDEEDFAGDFGHNDEASLDGASLVDSTEATSTLPKTPAKDEALSKKSTPATKTKKKDSISNAGDDNSAVDDAPAPSSPILSKKSTSRKSTLDSTKIETPTKSSIPPVPPIPAAVATPVKTALPPIRYAAAAAAAVANSGSSAPSQVQAPLQESPVKAKVELPSTSPVKEAPQVNGHAPPPPPGLGRTPSSAPTPAPVAPAAAPPAVSMANGSSVDLHSPSPAYASQNASRIGTPLQSLSHTHGESSRSGSAADFARRGSIPPQSQPQLPGGSSAAVGPQVSSMGPQQGSAPVMVGQSQGPPPSRSNHPPGIMGTLMHGFELTKDQAERRGENAALLQPSLEASYHSAPHQLDGEPPKNYVARNPVKTPSYYPQTRSPAVYDKSVYERLDQDTLFFLFYYYTGSYEQWLAARKLKEQNWRFHKQYLTWFKRAHQPQAITDDYEQGGYFYFDWENNWCQRKKSDFRFEYRWLSDQ